MAGILSCLLFLSSLALLPQVSPESAKRTFGILGQVIPALDLYGTSDRDAEAAGRYARYEEAISAPLSLFGRGVGAYGEYARDPTDYVHNLALEAYYETGAVGIAVIGVVFFYCLAGLLRFALKGRNLALFCLVGLIFYLTDAQFSGTLIHDVGSLCFLVVGCMAIGVEKHLERVDRANADGGIGARSGSRGRSIQQSPQFRRMSGGNFFGRSNDRG
jgi:O-antigen ligase